MNKRILFILDPLEKLEPDWDNSLALLREMLERDHQCWATDVPAIWATEKNLFSTAFRMRVSRSGQLLQGKKTVTRMESFDLILIRKEPPFNLPYYYMTLLLERLKGKVAFSNNPSGIRNANEKLATFLIPKWAPRSVIAGSLEPILRFQRKLGKPVVYKPLNQKGGDGVCLLGSPRAIRAKLSGIFRHPQTVLVQEQIKNRPSSQGDKRIIVLEGKILAAYEKHPPKNDFRTNLSLCGTSHPTKLTAKEKWLVSELRPYLIKEGLHLVGLDVMENKLLDLNVTCPAGLTVARALYPRLSPVQSWADFLERLRP